jgi:transcriptional regulator GlxA family with amidase domain
LLAEIDGLLSCAQPAADMGSEPFTDPNHLHYEQVFIATLLFEHSNSYSEFMSAPRGGAVPRHVRRAEEYIRANAGSVITTESLAREVNATARTLQLAFNKFRGCTPMQMVKAIRLEIANKELLSSDPDSASVTSIALKWGFTHLGVFAQDYRARFGEAPSATLRRQG